MIILGVVLVLGTQFQLRQNTWQNLPYKKYLTRFWHSLTYNCHSSNLSLTPVAEKAHFPSLDVQQIHDYYARWRVSVELGVSTNRQTAMTT